MAQIAQWETLWQWVRMQILSNASIGTNHYVYIVLALCCQWWRACGGSDAGISVCMDLLSLAVDASFFVCVYFCGFISRPKLYSAIATNSTATVCVDIRKFARNDFLPWKMNGRAFVCLFICLQCSPTFFCLSCVACLFCDKAFCESSFPKNSHSKITISFSFLSRLKPNVIAMDWHMKCTASTRWDPFSQRF